MIALLVTDCNCLFVGSNYSIKMHFCVMVFGMGGSNNIFITAFPLPFKLQPLWLFIHIFTATNFWSVNIDLKPISIAPKATAPRYTREKIRNSLVTNCNCVSFGNFSCSGNRTIFSRGKIYYWKNSSRYWWSNSAHIGHKISQSYCFDVFSRNYQEKL